MAADVRRHAEALARIVGAEAVKLGPRTDGRYVQDLWGSDRAGVANLIVTPPDPARMAKVLAYCNQHQQPLVVQGGMTGLVSGGVPGPEEIVVSTELLNGIGEVDRSAGTVRVGAGVILSRLSEAVREEGFVVPIDLAPKDAATIGGCVATNAGGVNVVGYGMTRQHVRAVQVALADGRLMELSTSLVKDNAGYDLKQLFIGSEGTLGVVTEVTLALRARPTSRFGAFASVRSVDDALALLAGVRRSGAGTVSAFEVIWADAYAVLEDTGLRLPLPPGDPMYVLLEIESSGSGGRGEEAFAQCLEQISEFMIDCALALSEGDLRNMWKARERIPVEVLGQQPLFGFDVSVKGKLLEKCLEQMRAELHRHWPRCKLLVFGHLGDDNVHIAVVTGERTRERKAEVEEIVYTAVRAFGGSISAEHGIGFEKLDYLTYTRSQGEVSLMCSIKQLLDPVGILNRGRVLPWRGRDGNA